MSNDLKRALRDRALLIAGALAAGLWARAAGARPAEGRFADWTMGGHDLAGSRSNPFEREIGPGNARSLTLKWTAATADVSATPAVHAGAVYFPDWKGQFWKLDARSGRVLWQHAVASYDGTASNAFYAFTLPHHAPFR